MQERLRLTKEDAQALIRKYGSPVYVYDENILRRRCQEIRNLCNDPLYQPFYSVKANTNIELLKIIRQEGLHADAMSLGEIVQEEAAGFSKEEIVCCSNNMKQEEMRFAHDHARIVVLDSIDQIKLYGRLYPHEKIGIRINPGIGDGHNQKVITGGHTKFGIPLMNIPALKEVLSAFDLTVSFLHCHVGSQYLKDDIFLQAVECLLKTGKEFPYLEEIDFGGGFGIPYAGENRLNLSMLGSRLKKLKDTFAPELIYHVEPGRYIVGECGELIGTVTSVKENDGTLYAGTDIGFNVMMRHVLYGSHHDIAVYGTHANLKKYTVTGNICETGDILGEDMMLEEMEPGDLIGVLDAGAYGFSMASNYNGRLRPAEVLWNDGKARLIRKRETAADLLRQL